VVRLLVWSLAGRWLWLRYVTLSLLAPAMVPGTLLAGLGMGLFSAGLAGPYVRLRTEW